MRDHRKFTKRETAVLQENPYVAAVTPCQVRYTVAFKKVFWHLYTAENMSPVDIMERLGFDVKVLGLNRVQQIPPGLKAQYEKYGDFHEGRKHEERPSTTHVNPNATTVPPEAAINIERLQHELEFVKQELEFIKKTILADREAQRK